MSRHIPRGDRDAVVPCQSWRADGEFQALAVRPLHECRRELHAGLAIGAAIDEDATRGDIVQLRADLRGMRDRTEAVDVDAIPRFVEPGAAPTNSWQGVALPVRRNAVLARLQEVRTNTSAVAGAARPATSAVCSPATSRHVSAPRRDCR